MDRPTYHNLMLEAFQYIYKFIFNQFLILFLMVVMKPSAILRISLQSTNYSLVMDKLIRYPHKS